MERSYPFGVRFFWMNGSIPSSPLSRASSISTSERTAISTPFFSADDYFFDNDILSRFVVPSGLDLRDRIDNLDALDNLAKHGMRTRIWFLVIIKVAVIHDIDEPLASPGVRSTVRHRNRPPHVTEVLMELVFDRVPRASCSSPLRATAL